MRSASASDTDALAERFAKLQRRAEALTDSAGLADLLRELETTLQEVRVHEGKLRRAADELAAARDVLGRDEERQRSLFELAPDAYLITDRYGRILEANRAAETIFGLPRPFLQQKVLAGFIPLHERKAFRRQLIKLADAHGVFETEMRLATKSRTIDVSMSVAAIRNHGTVEGFRWIIRDITARKQTEWELRTLNLELEARVVDRTRDLEQERARLHAIVEQVPTGLVITDAEGEPVFMNGHAEDLLADLRATEHPGFPRRFPALRIDGDPYPDEERPSTRALVRGETTTAERLYFERKDGTRSLFEVSAAPIRDSLGRITAAALTVQDVSDLERLERSEREFVANAAHQLRTPIAAVVSAVEVLQSGAKENPQDRDLFLGHIEREANRLGRLAHGLLVLARAQAGRTSIQPELVELCPLLEEIARTLGRSRNVNIAVECERDLTVWSSRDLLEQAVASLASNALEHTREGRVTLAAHQAKETVDVEVRDTGRGIETAVQKRVFERFYRGNGATREGFGLGLSIVQQAAEALTAQVELDSEVGRGTTVRLRLPGKLRA